MRDRAYHPAFKYWAIFAAVGVILLFSYRIVPQRIIPGDAGMTTLMMLSNETPSPLANDPVYRHPVKIYSRLFIEIRRQFLALSGGDMLSSVKWLCATLFAMQIICFFGFFYWISKDPWISMMAAAGMTAYAFLPSSMTWGFHDLYQTSNRQVFWAFFPLIFAFFCASLNRRRRILPLAAIGVIGNSHPGEAINAFIILSTLLIIARFRHESVFGLIRDLFISGIAFSIFMLPVVSGFFRVGEVGPVRKVLSADEIETIARFADWAIASDYHWLRFLSHPIVFGSVFFSGQCPADVPLCPRFFRPRSSATCHARQHHRQPARYRTSVLVRDCGNTDCRSDHRHNHHP